MTKKPEKHNTSTSGTTWAARTSDGTYADDEQSINAPAAPDGSEVDDTTIVFDDGQAYQHVAFALPRRVLYALIDAGHPDANAEQAVALGLGYFSAGKDEPHHFVLSEMGKLVIGGTDQIALRHKMLADWRASHNAEVDNT